MKVSNEVTVGALTVIAIVIFVLGYQFLRGQEVFSRSQLVLTEFPDATGVYEANMVMLNGVPIGRINKIEYRNGHPDMPVLIKLALDKDLEIPQDSRFEIQTLDLLGKRAISFIPGRSKVIAKKGVILPGSIKEDMIAAVAKELTPIADKAETLLTSIDTLVKDVHKTLGPNEQNAISVTIASAQSAMANLNNITSRINGILVSQQGNLEGTLANVKKLTESLAANTEEIDSILVNFNSFSGQMAELELKETVESAKNTLSTINSLLAKIESGEGSIGKLVSDDSLYTGINNTISSLNNLLIDVKSNPKKYVSFSLIERKQPKTPATQP